MAEQVLSDADRLIEGARSQGRSGYQRAARRSVAYGRTFRAAVLLQGRCVCRGPWARMTADRCRTPPAAAADPARSGHLHRRAHKGASHGRRVAELLHELLARRIEMVETALEGAAPAIPGLCRGTGTAASSGARP